MDCGCISYIIGLTDASINPKPFMHSGQCNFVRLATNFHKLVVHSSYINRILPLRLVENGIS